MKCEGWEKLAVNHIEQAVQAKVIWGSSDCVLFASDWAYKATGKDPAASIRGKYASEAEARDLIDSAEKPPEIVMNDFFERVNYKFASRGDIVFKRTETGFCFGIVWDGKAVFKVDGKGVFISEITEDFIVWRVD